MQEMEVALKIIAGWANWWSEGSMSDDTRKHCMKQIRDKAMQGLGRDEESR
jgi:hypothetical protein